MFTFDKSTVSIAIDSTSKPFWTTGDVITGSLRVVVVDTKLVLSGIHISLVCDEIGAVSTEERLRESKNLKKPKKPHQLTKKTVNHFTSNKSIAEAYQQTQEPRPQSQSHNAIALDPGEYVFPFAMDLEEDINSCPPHSPIRTRGNIDIGVRWELRAVVRRWSKFHSNITASQMIPVFPRNPSIPATYSIVQGNTILSELSGEDPIDINSSKFSSIFKRKKKTPLKLRANLKYPSREIPQGQKPLPLRLFLELQGADSNDDDDDINLHSISIYILRKCQCRIKGKQDTYLTRHPIGSVTASRKISASPLNLTNLINSFALQEVLPASFSAKMLEVSYDLLMSVEYSSSQDNKLRVFELFTPIDVTAPYLCWSTPALPISESAPQVAFNDTPPSSANRTRSVATTWSATTGTTGTTYSTIGTINSYRIQGPTQLFTNWIASWKPTESSWL